MRGISHEELCAPAARRSIKDSALMYVNPFAISMETLIGAAPLLGHALEDRGEIRHAQDWQLAQGWQQRTSTDLRSASQQDLFCVAPLDILVTEEAGRKKFHLIEINGT